MSESPNIYLDEPDPLSVLLGKLELSAEVYVNGAFCGTWAVDTGGSRRIPFHLIGDGDAWLHFEDGEPVHLHELDFLVFPHDSHHVISNSEDAPPPEQVNAPMTNDGATTQMVCGFFEFRNPALFPLLEAVPAVLHVSAQPGKLRNRIADLANMILCELEESRPGHYAAIDQLAFLIFIEVIRQQVEEGLLSEGILTALFDYQLGRVLNEMHQNPQLPWTLEALAEKAAMSRSSFAERFVKMVGVTPMKYLADWRMTEARRLLATTRMSTAQVAERSGYQSEAAFRKAFKNILGVTPGAVRTTARGMHD